MKHFHSHFPTKLTFTFALTGITFCGLCEQTFAQTDSTPKPTLEEAKQIVLPKELANSLLQDAMQAQLCPMIRAAIRCGADIKLFYQSPLRLQLWDHLLLNEELHAKAGQSCTYSAEDWAIVFESKQERYIHPVHLKAIVEHLQSKGVDINEASKAGTPLELALKTYQKHVVQVILDAGAKTDMLSEEQNKKMQKILAIDYKSTWTTTVKNDPTGEKQAKADLENALRWQDEDLIAKAMLRVRALKHDREIINACFIEQVERNRVNEAKFLLNQGADINSIGKTYTGNVGTALTIAASELTPNSDLAAYLIEKGGLFLTAEQQDSRSPITEKAAINAKSEGRTPLLIHLQDHRLTGSNYYAPAKATQFYLKLGADVHAQDDKGRTALWYALNDYQVLNLEALLLAQAKVNHRDKSGRTPLFDAVEKGCLLTIFMLLEAGANPEILDNKGKGIETQGPAQELLKAYR